MFDGKKIKMGNLIKVYQNFNMLGISNTLEFCFLTIFVGSIYTNLIISLCMRSDPSF